MTTQRVLVNTLKEIEAQIKAARLRLPAHSVKPALMMELLRLEDERDSLLTRLQALRSEET
jgi:hypothetical protein